MDKVGPSSSGRWKEEGEGTGGLITTFRLSPEDVRENIVLKRGVDRAWVDSRPTLQLQGTVRRLSCTSTILGDTALRTIKVSQAFKYLHHQSSFSHLDALSGV